MSKQKQQQNVSTRKSIKNRIKNNIKKLIHKGILFLIKDKFLTRTLIQDEFFIEELNKVKKQREISSKNFLLEQLQSCGQEVKLNGKTFISNPKSVTIGHNVHIGDNAYIVSEGGLTIGDNTHISRNITIYTVNHNYQGKALPYDHIGMAKPVAIGKNVWIGMNVSIVPGVSIGDGAIIGMGTVVTQDVPPLAIIGSQHHRILKYRNAEHYQDLESKRSYGGVNGQILDPKQLEHLENNRDNIFFVVTTGRSGSTTISALLSQHSQITCLHEPRPQLIRLSTEFAHGEKSYQQTRDELYSIYCNSSVYPLGVYGESEQKLWNLIEILAELIPSSKFIWLIRDGRDVVASTYGRGWFNEDVEQRFGDPSASNKDILHRWMYYRLNGALCGVYTQEEWRSLSVFERNCWYWSYVNSSIKKQLELLPEKRWTTLKLEDLSDRVNDIYNFLNVKCESLSVPKANSYTSVANYYPGRKPNSYHWKNWNDSEKLSFLRLCGEQMDSYYSDWREDFINEESLILNGNRMKNY